MPDFLSYDPKTGVRKFLDLDDDTLFIHAEQDVEPLLDHTADLRNSRIYDERGREFNLYCKIPPVVQLKLRQMGINIYSKDPEMIRKMFQAINAHFPYLKVTNKHHE